jgi:hypothetical protein
MRIKQDLSAYNAPIYLRTECSERKKSRGPNNKKIREFNSNLVHNLHCEFSPHRHWRRELRCALAKLFAPHPLKVVTSEKIGGSGVTSTLGTWYGGVVSYNEATILYRDFNSAPSQ